MKSRKRQSRRFWTPKEEAELRALYSDTPTKELAQRFRRDIRQVYAKASDMGLAKSSAYLAGPHAQRLRRGDNVGAKYRFPKGHVPANKGLRRPGWGPGRMKETQFKPGTLHGRANRNWKPLGTEVVNRDGYLVRKIAERGLQRQKWRPVHLLLWEGHHGKVPAGYALVFRNGNPLDIRLENLELITRQELMRRNTVHNLPKSVAQVIQLRGALIRQINRRSQKGATA